MIRATVIDSATAMGHSDSSKDSSSKRSSPIESPRRIESITRFIPSSGTSPSTYLAGSNTCGPPTQNVHLRAVARN